MITPGLAGILGLPDPSLLIIDDFTDGTLGQSAAWWNKYWATLAYWWRHRPWVVSWVIPVAPVPGLAGVGPAGDVEWNPETKTLCGGLGIGASAGKNVAIGPLTNGKLSGGKIYPSGADNLLGGGSLSGGYNSPGLIGVQGVANGAGVAYGPSVGVPGFSGAAKRIQVVTNSNER